jgi:hypothetical protein
MSVAVVEPAGLTINDPRRRIFATIEASVGNPVKWYDCRSYSQGAVSSRSKAFDVVGTALPMTSLYTSCGAPVKAEPFPTQARAPSVWALLHGRERNIRRDGRVCSSSAQVTGFRGVFPRYVTALCAAALAAAILMPDTSRSGYTSKAKKRCRHAVGRNRVRPDPADRSPERRRGRA